MSSALLPETTTADAQGWHLVPRFMLRVGGLSFGTADRLVTAGSAGWADEVLEADARLRADAVVLADALGEFVAGTIDAPEARRLLINLRRDVFNLRPPRGLAAAERILPDGLLGVLRSWVADRERRAALVSAGRDLVGAEVTAARAILREIAEEPDLRCGIQLSSPSLDEHLGVYLEAGPGKLSKRTRRIERSLLEYLYRTACKTSPFGTLTSVCLGSFTEDEDKPLRAEVADWRKDSSTRLNMGVLARLSALMTTTPEVRRMLPVRATGGLEVHSGRVRYLRRLQSMGGNEEAAVNLDTLHERLFFLPSGRTLEDLLSLLGDGGPVRFDELAKRLGELDPGRSASDVDEYLAHLLRLGLLVVPNLQLDIHDPDPVGTYRSGLRQLGTDWADRTADLVAGMDTAVGDFAAADLVRRRALLARIRESVTEAHRVLGREDVGVVRTLVYEDTTVPAAVVTGSRRLWTDELSAGLRQIAAILPAFDGNLVRRMVTKGYFLTRHGAGGRCTDFLSFAHEFGQDLYDNYSQRLMRHQRFDGTRFQPYDNWFRQSEITDADQARALAAEELGRLYRDRADGEDLTLGQDFVDKVSGKLPDGPANLQPLSFFLQVADDGSADPLIVLNRVYAGLTLLFSRFAHLFGDELPAELRRSLTAILPDGAVFAELKGGYDATNLNLHPVVTPYEIVSPGEVSFRAEADQIPVEDLVIEHDAATDRLLLRSRRLGVEVIPVYLGFLMPMALPEIQQILLNFSYASLAQLDLWSGVDLPDAGIVELPRIRLGNVVLQRRSWRIPAADFPVGKDDAGEHEWYLDWRRWRSAANLPRRVFASLGGEHKPQYVDFDSYFSVRLLHLAARGAEGTAVLTEMLPGPDELWLRDGDDRYVTELTIELDGLRTEQ